MNESLRAQQILADTVDNTRQLTRFYLRKSEGLDYSKRFEIEGFTTNNIHWIIAHLAWAESFLILKAVADQNIDVPWLKKFEIGTESPGYSDFPSLEETKEVFNDIHRKSLEIIKALPDEGLNRSNHTGLKFGNDDSKLGMIKHCIRHEAMHTGQISWLVRMMGKKII